MEKHLCAECSREFQSAESLGQHRQAKHTAQPPASAGGSSGKGKSPRTMVILAVVALLLVGGYFVFAGRGGDSGPGGKPLITGAGAGGEAGGEGASDDFDEAVFAAQIPKGSIHWHPHVTISIKGREAVIPANLGLGGRAHLPVHTHDTDGVLHWEVGRPTVENMQLGFFFNKVWGKKFGSQCVLDSCNGPDGTLRMYVNGVENTEFDHYMPRDKDEIKIVFE